MRPVADGAPAGADRGGAHHMTATFSATAAAQDTGHNTVESFRGGGRGAPGRGYEMRPDHRLTTSPEMARRRGGSKEPARGRTIPEGADVSAQRAAPSGSLGAARIAERAIVAPSRITGDRLVAVAVRQPSRTGSGSSRCSTHVR